VFKIAITSFERDLTTSEQIEVMELQIGILQVYIGDHQKEIALATIAQAKIDDYQEQIRELDQRISELQSGLK
jgi:peptidoglycan hydrolase CwlO-like protein